MITASMRRVSLAFALLAFASFARAESLRVVAPANGATLRGGSFAELRWTSAQLPPAAEEWEAFLSIDGGKYYAFRVTPHLDIQLRSFTFVVPNVDTRNARILIRTGDEVHELHFESRDSFSIVRDAKAEAGAPARAASPDAAKRRATAIPASWRGRTARATDRASRSNRRRRCRLRPFDDSTIVVTATFPIVPPGANLLFTPVPLRGAASPRASDTSSQGRAAPGRSVDLLLVCSRRNI